MHYYIIIHAEEEFTSLLSGRAAWAQIVILKRGFKRGRGVICGRWEHLAGVILRLQPPGGDTPRPPNTHTHTLRDGGARPSPSNRCTRCARLRAAELRAAMRAPLPSHPPPPTPLNRQHGKTARTRNLRGEPLTAHQTRAAQTTPLSLRRDALRSPHRCGSAWLRLSRLRASPWGPRAELLLTRHQRVEQLGEGLLF